MKKLCVWLLAAALCLGLASCGSQTASKGAPESAESAESVATAPEKAENVATDAEKAVSAEAEKAYQDKIAELEKAIPEGDSPLTWTLISCGTGAKVLVVAKASEIYADGQTISADVYQYADGAVKSLGSVESGGTAYPVSYTKDAVIFGGNHQAGKLAIHDGTADLFLITGTYMETKNPTLEVYSVADGEMTLKSSEEIPAEKADDYDYYINAFANETAEIILFQ